MVAGSYRIEYAKSGRAVCTVKACKEVKNMIPKGSLRLGSWAQIEERGWYAWRHWGCITPQQCANITESIEDDWDLFDGYDELEEDDQEKVRQAISDRHVADDDLTPYVDALFNRVGAKEAIVEAQKQRIREEKAQKKAAEKEAKLAEKEAKKKLMQVEKQRIKAEKERIKAEKLDEKESAKAKEAALETSDEDAVKSEEPPETKPAKSIKAEKEETRRMSKIKSESQENGAVEDADAIEPDASHTSKKRKRSSKSVKVEKDDESNVDVKLEKVDEGSHATSQGEPNGTDVKQEDGESKIDGSRMKSSAFKDRKKVKKEEALQDDTNDADQPVVRRSTRRKKA